MLHLLSVRSFPDRNSAVPGSVFAFRFEGLDEAFGEPSCATLALPVDADENTYDGDDEQQRQDGDHVVFPSSLRARARARARIYPSSIDQRLGLDEREGEIGPRLVTLDDSLKVLGRLLDGVEASLLLFAEAFFAFPDVQTKIDASAFDAETGDRERSSLAGRIIVAAYLEK